MVAGVAEGGRVPRLGLAPAAAAGAGRKRLRLAAPLRMEWEQAVLAASRAGGWGLGSSCKNEAGGAGRGGLGGQLSRGQLARVPVARNAPGGGPGQTPELSRTATRPFPSGFTRNLGHDRRVPGPARGQAVGAAGGGGGRRRYWRRPERYLWVATPLARDWVSEN